MEALRCPSTVGRDAELARLGRALDAAAEGRGGVAVLVGEAGVGKSRLAAELVDRAGPGWLRLRGRAVPSGAPAPLRAWAEALSAAWRGRGPPSAPHAEGLRPAQELLVPAWRVPTAPPPADPSPVVLGEAARALLAGAPRDGGVRGVVVVLEDLHDADPETVEVLDYLAGALDGAPVLVLATVRSEDEGEAACAVRALARRPEVTPVDLRPLTDAAVADMVRAMFAGTVPPELVDAVVERADGVPFLVEELLGDLAEHGAGRRRPGEVRVPASFARSVADRLAALSPAAREVIETAAVLGEDCAPAALVTVSGRAADAVDAALARASSCHLVVRHDAGARFRHALTRDAVLDGMSAARRRRVARHALAVVGDPGDDADPELRGRVAALAEMAGRPEEAVDLQLAVSRESLRRGLVGSARRAAVRAGELAGSPRRAVAADRALLDAEVAAGDPARIRDRGVLLLTRLQALDAPAEERAAVHGRLAAAAIAATDWDRAADHLRAAARTVAAPGPALRAAVAAGWAEVALGRHRGAEAAEHAEVARVAAVEAGLVDLEAEASMLRGRAVRLEDLDEAARCFTAAVARAEATGSPLRSSRALLELGTVGVIRCGDPGPLESARALAVEAGAPGVAATVDLQLAVLQWKRAAWASARAAARRAITGGERHGLGLLVPLARIVEGCVDAVHGHRAAAQAAFDVARGAADPEIEASGRGNLLAVAALAVEDRAGALAELDRAVALVPAGSASARSPYRGLHALLLALGGDPGAEAVAAEVRALPTVDAVAGAYATLAGAVLAGRSGDEERARALAAAGDEALATAPWLRALGRRLVGEAALAGGWDEPATSLVEAHAYFDELGLTGPAAACRALLRRAGVSRPRGASRADPAIGPGLTDREAEVLDLLAEGLPNRAIADRLFVSPRTVEKHVERLLAKTGTTGRAELAVRAAREGRGPAGPVPPGRDQPAQEPPATGVRGGTGGVPRETTRSAPGASAGTTGARGGTGSRRR